MEKENGRKFYAFKCDVVNVSFELLKRRNDKLVQREKSHEY